MKRNNFYEITVTGKESTYVAQIKVTELMLKSCCREGVVNLLGEQVMSMIDEIKRNEEKKE